MVWSASARGQKENIGLIEKLDVRRMEKKDCKAGKKERLERFEKRKIKKEGGSGREEEVLEVTKEVEGGAKVKKRVTMTVTRQIAVGKKTAILQRADPTRCWPFLEKGPLLLETELERGSQRPVRKREGYVRYIQR